jgi:glutaredoxin
MKKITMYSLSTCPWCKKAKEFFSQQGIAYESTDYDLVDGEKQQRIDRDMHDMAVGGFPVVKIGTDVVVGYRPDRYRELLGLKEA